MYSKSGFQLKLYPIEKIDEMLAELAILNDGPRENTFEDTVNNLTKLGKPIVSHFYKIGHEKWTFVFKYTHWNRKEYLIQVVCNNFNTDFLSKKLARLIPFTISKIVQRELNKGL